MAEPTPPAPIPPAPSSAAPHARGMARRLAGGMSALAVNLALNMVLQLLTVPVFVAAWGTEQYGSWIVLNAAAGMLALMDLGLQVHLGSVIRHAAALGDHRRLQNTVSAGLALYASVLALGAGLLLLATFGFGLPRMLGVTGHDAEQTFLLIALSHLVLLPRGLLGCVFSARGQLSTEVHLASIQQLSPPLALLACAMLGGDIGLSALVLFAATLVTGWLPLIVVLRWRHADVSLRPRWPGTDELRGYLRKSLLHAAPNGASVLMLQLPVLAINHFAPGAAVVVFTTMRTYTGLLRQLGTQIIVPATLEMTRQYAQGDRAGLERLFLATCRLAGGALALAGAFALSAGHRFFAVWTHGAVRFDILLAAIFVLSALAMIPAVCAATLLRHTDHPEPLIRAHLRQCAMGAVLCLVLVPFWSAHGAAVAYCLSELMALGTLALTAASGLFGLNVRTVLLCSGRTILLSLLTGLALATALGRLPWPEGVPGLLMLSTAWGLSVAPLAPWLLLSARHRYSMFAAARRLSKVLR